MNNIKKFEDFLDKMRGVLDNAKKQGHINVRVEDLESVLSELKESEDERIIKALKEGFKYHQLLNPTFGGIPCVEIVNWLEKQGEQKHTDKTEPKFHKGQWIVSDYNSVAYIKSISETKYNLQCKDGNHKKMSIEYVDRCWHLWNIQDAKPGDVLVADFEDDNIIIMYHSRCTIDTINVYCCLDNNKFISENLGVFDAENVKPATKEQCDLLFSKMKEAGYEWDAEKKELRKIKQEPIWEWDANTKELKKIEQKSSWSEEDERLYQSIIDDTVQENQLDSKQIDWLKSIKQRIEE